MNKEPSFPNILVYFDKDEYPHWTQVRDVFRHALTFDADQGPYWGFPMNPEDWPEKVFHQKELPDLLRGCMRLLHSAKDFKGNYLPEGTSETLKDLKAVQKVMAKNFNMLKDQELQHTGQSTVTESMMELVDNLTWNNHRNHLGQFIVEPNHVRITGTIAVRWLTALLLHYGFPVPTTHKSNITYIVIKKVGEMSGFGLNARDNVLELPLSKINPS